MSGGTLDDDDSVEPVAMELCDAWKPLGDLLVVLRRGAPPLHRRPLSLSALARGPRVARARGVASAPTEAPSALARVKRSRRSPGQSLSR